jgi:hypothetical protein
MVFPLWIRCERFNYILNLQIAKGAFAPPV